jgi:hypothetical protein
VSPQSPHPAREEYGAPGARLANAHNFNIYRIKMNISEILAMIPSIKTASELDAAYGSAVSQQKALARKANRDSDTMTAYQSANGLMQEIEDAYLNQHRAIRAMLAA